MEKSEEKRRRERKITTPMGIGIAYLQKDGDTPGCLVGQRNPVLFIDLLNKSDEGICLRITHRITLEEPFIMQFYDRNEQKWYLCRCLGKWINQDKADPDFFLMGCAYQRIDDKNTESSGDTINEKAPPIDYEFLKVTRFFKTIDRGGLCPLLNAMTFQRVPAGKKIIKQGEQGDACFIIQKGICTVYIERGCEKYQIARIKKGNIVGEMAILTGEVRSASVEAETDMELWQISRDQFDDISGKYPDVRNFLTELVTERFSSRKRTAKREVGKYVITDIIGKGGSAMVYGGLHQDLNMAVAVKMMNHDMAMNEDFLKKFRNEARLIAQFNHRNIVKVYDIEERFRTIFIIMELLQGMSLYEELSDLSKLPYPKIVDYLIQISSGLAYAHERGVVHQDIKPANIFIQHDDQVKILDFGVACPIATENIDFPGTPYYMSPEQIEMESVDERSDIYSLGLLAYEMVTGQRPYPDDDLVRLEELHATEDIPDPRNSDPDIPEELRQFILKACSRDREKRYRNIQEVLAQVQPLKEKYGPGKKDISRGKRKMTSLILFSNEADQPALNLLLEEFSLKAQALGITLKAADFSDI